MKLRKVLFWDTDYNQVNFDKHSDYVIGRVVMFGSLKEWNDVLEYYGREKVKEVVCNSSELDLKTINFLSVYFNIPKESFKCYTQKSSKKAHFPF